MIYCWPVIHRAVRRVRRHPRRRVIKHAAKATSITVVGGGAVTWVCLETGWRPSGGWSIDNGGSYGPGGNYGSTGSNGGGGGNMFWSGGGTVGSVDFGGAIPSLQDVVLSGAFDQIPTPEDSAQRLTDKVSTMSTNTLDRQSVDQHVPSTVDAPPLSAFMWIAIVIGIVINKYRSSK